MIDSREQLGRAGEGAPVSVNRQYQNGMQSVQNLEVIINEGLRVALQEETPDQSLEVLLEHLGKALNGERTYIFEQNESGGDDNTYEWAADGVEPEKENLQNVPPGGVRQLVSEFQYRQAYRHQESGRYPGERASSV